MSRNDDDDDMQQAPQQQQRADSSLSSQAAMAGGRDAYIREVIGYCSEQPGPFGLGSQGPLTERQPEFNKNVLVLNGPADSGGTSSSTCRYRISEHVLHVVEAESGALTGENPTFDEVILLENIGRNATPDVVIMTGLISCWGIIITGNKGDSSDLIAVHLSRPRDNEAHPEHPMKHLSQFVTEHTDVKCFSGTSFTAVQATGVTRVNEEIVAGQLASKLRLPPDQITMCNSKEMTFFPQLGTFYPGNKNAAAEFLSSPLGHLTQGDGNSGAASASAAATSSASTVREAEVSDKDLIGMFLSKLNARPELNGELKHTSGTINISEIARLADAAKNAGTLSPVVTSPLPKAVLDTLNTIAPGHRGQFDPESVRAILKSAFRAQEMGDTRRAQHGA